MLREYTHLGVRNSECMAEVDGGEDRATQRARLVEGTNDAIGIVMRQIGSRVKYNKNRNKKLFAITLLCDYSIVIYFYNYKNM